MYTTSAPLEFQKSMFKLNNMIGVELCLWQMVNVKLTLIGFLEKMSV